MSELTPEIAMEHLVMTQPQDVARVVVVTRAPGLSEDDKARAAYGITQIMAQLDIFNEHSTDNEMQVDFVTQVDMVDGGGEE